MLLVSLYGNVLIKVHRINRFCLGLNGSIYLLEERILLKKQAYNCIISLSYRVVSVYNNFYVYLSANAISNIIKIIRYLTLLKISKVAIDKLLQLSSICTYTYKECKV